MLAGIFRAKIALQQFSITEVGPYQMNEIESKSDAHLEILQGVYPDTISLLYEPLF